MHINVFATGTSIQIHATNGSTTTAIEVNTAYSTFVVAKISFGIIKPQVCTRLFGITIQITFICLKMIIPIIVYTIISTSS